jgi:hypothetical protein
MTDSLPLIAICVLFVIAGLSALPKLRGLKADMPYRFARRRPNALGGLVRGPMLMRIRPLRPGETSEKLIYPDGSVTDIGGILEPVDE